MLRVAISLVMMVMLCFPIMTSAATIVDTGTPDESNPWAFLDWQYFAGEFSTTDTHTVQSIEGFFGNEFSSESGQVTIGIHADGGARPGALLFSSTINMAAFAPLGWWGVSVNQLLGPGTYWASFIPSPEISGSMPGTAPSPLEEYAQGCSSTSTTQCFSFASTVDGWYDVPADSFDYLDVGVRINGELQAVPDSTTTFGLMLIVMLVGAFVLRGRARTA